MSLDRTRLRSVVARVPGARRAKQALASSVATGPRINAAGRIVDVSSLVMPSQRRSVVLLAHPTQRDEVLRWLGEFAADRVHVLAAKETAEWQLDSHGAAFRKTRNFSQLDLELKKLGTIDIIVNLLHGDLLPGRDNDQLALFRRVFRFVSRGGAYILDRSTAPAESAVLGMERWTKLLAASEDPAVAASLRPREVELAESVGTVIVSRDQVVATKRFDHLLKLRDADVVQILPPREPELTLTELDRRRAREFVGRATVVSHGDLVSQDTFPDRFDVPALTARNYRGEIGSPGGTLLFTGRTILPDSFRWHLSGHPRNVRLTSGSPHFARIESRFIPERRLAGNYYTFDSSHSGHFGHLTTEVMSRLWGWDRAKQEMPDLKALFHLKPRSRRHPQLEIDLLTAYGIAEEDIVWVNEPVWLESVASATPMWHNEEPYYVDPDLGLIWNRLTEGLLSRAPATKAHDRLFVSRKVANRSCLNRAEVETYLEARGFHTVFPEELSLPEQVALFEGASVIAGFAGSNMFNLMHARNLKTTIVLSQDAYLARNEHLFTAVRGGDAHYFWSPSNIAHPDGGFSKKAFYSDWVFDFASNGAELDEVIAGLD